MLGAIYTGLSGMDAYSKGLQTISNNVANLNSNGFKSTEVSFEDMASPGGEGSSLTSDDSDDSGGVRVAAPLIDFSQGTLQQTGNDLDLGIQGSGFLTVVDSDGETLYTRTGSFAVDSGGYISDQNTGDRLTVLDSTGTPETVNLNDKQTNPPAATTKVVFSDNLSSSGTTATVSNINVYDDRGGEQVWTATFTKSTAAAATDQWDVAVTDANGNSVGTSTLSFIGSTPDPSTDQMVVNTTPTGADPLAVTLDFSGVTSFSSGTSSTISAAPGDGNAEGTLSSVTIDDNGQLKLTYSNEQTQLLGAVTIADFKDTQKLQQLSDGLYKNASGDPVNLTSSDTDGVGTLTPDTLEASNVDLSSEFGDLILIQRGFQACSQVVSVTNDMIQQLFSIRGQS